MTIKQSGGIFGRNPTFNDVTIEGSFNLGTASFDSLTVDTDTLYVDGANDRVGVNTSSPVTTLESNTTGNGLPASSGTAQANGAFRISSTGTTGIIDIGPNGSAPWIQATDRTDLSQGYTLSLNPNGGNVSIGSGNLAFASGSGIDFSATAGTGTSELFDDYEEGTWTPEVADAQTGGNTAAGTFTGYYTKIGRIVNLMCILDNIDTTGMTGGNTLYVRNLPYAPASLTGAQRALSNVMMLNVAFNTSAIVTAEIPDNFTYARIAECSSGGSRTFITVGDLTSGTADINLQFNYYT